MKKKYIATILSLYLACGQTMVFAANQTDGSVGIVIDGDNNTVSSSNSVTLGNDISSLGGANVAIGYESKAGNQENPLGPNNANGATAVGTGSQAINYRATALGDYTVASGEDSIGIGTTAQATGDRSISAGLSSQASGVNAIAIGDKTISSSNDSVAIGEQASATGSQAIAIGSHSSASGAYSMAIGLNAKATNDWSVALGNSSETSEAVSTSTMTVGGKTYQTAGGSAKGTISVGNENIKRTITNVAAGRVTDSSTDAINGSQLFATNQGVDANAKNIAKGMNFAADTGTAYNAQLGDTVSIKGDGKNLSTSVDKGTITVHMSDTPGFTSVTANTVSGNTIKAGDTVTLSNQGADMGGTKITHLKNGDVSPTSTDAVNGSQLYSTENRINLLDSQVDHLGSQINRVGAGAAALAGLHPLDFDPDDKWDFAAGYGNYKNANAVAIGAYYRPNEDVMFSVGGSFSGGENMVNAGISWKFGQKSHVSRSRVSVAKDVLALQQQVAVLTKELEAYRSGIGNNGNASMKRNINFPDVPENHWAYTYVQTLADKGYLKGYPDGEFKGDRALTRYEYAAIIYYALQNGAPSDGSMIRSMDEFGPEISKAQELDRFRVDRISGKDNDRYKVERIRVNDKDDKASNVFRDIYGSHIQK